MPARLSSTEPPPKLFDIVGYIYLSGHATNQASEIESVNIRAFVVRTHLA
jgi:hypothetical protein